MNAAAITAVLSLGLLASPYALAGTEDHKKSGEEQSGEHKTIQGVVAGVTVVGETMVDYESHRAVTAEKDFLTIVGHPKHHVPGGEQARQEQQEHGSGSQAQGSAKQDKEVRQTSGNEKRSGEAKHESGEKSGRSANIYMIGVSRDTEVCECQGESKKKCDLARLEIGDRVEIEYTPVQASQAQTGDTRHGRHRMMRGEARSIMIVHEEGQHEESSSSHESGNKEEKTEKDKSGKVKG